MVPIDHLVDARLEGLSPPANLRSLIPDLIFTGHLLLVTFARSIINSEQRHWIVELCSGTARRPYQSVCLNL
jgi:hypothetical protein